MGLLPFGLAALLALLPSVKGSKANFKRADHGVDQVTATKTLTNFVFTCPCDSTASNSLGTAYPSISVDTVSGHVGWQGWDSAFLTSTVIPWTSATYTSSIFHDLTTSTSIVLNISTTSTTTSTSFVGYTTSFSHPYGDVPTTMGGSHSLSSSMSISSSYEYDGNSSTTSASVYISTTTSTTADATTTSTSRDGMSSSTTDSPSTTLGTTSQYAVNGSTTITAQGTVTISGEATSTTSTMSTLSSIATTSDFDPTTSTSATSNLGTTTTVSTTPSMPTAGQPFSIYVDTGTPGKIKRDILVMGFINGQFILVSSPAQAVAFVLTPTGVMMIFGTNMVVGFASGTGTLALAVFSDASSVPTAISWSASSGSLSVAGAGLCIGAGNVMSVVVGAGSDDSCSAVNLTPNTATDSYNTALSTSVTPSPATSITTSGGSTTISSTPTSTTISSQTTASVSEVGVTSAVMSTSTSTSNSLIATTSSASSTPTFECEDPPVALSTNVPDTCQTNGYFKFVNYPDWYYFEVCENGVSEGTPVSQTPATSLRVCMDSCNTLNECLYAVFDSASKICMLYPDGTMFGTISTTTQVGMKQRPCTAVSSTTSSRTTSVTTSSSFAQEDTDESAAPSTISSYPTTSTTSTLSTTITSSDAETSTITATPITTLADSTSSLSPTPTCTNDFKEVVTSSDGTTYSAFFAGCGKRILSFDWTYITSTSYDITTSDDDALSLCASLATQKNANSFSLYQSHMFNFWVCEVYPNVATNDFAFKPHDTGKTWGYALKSRSPSASTTSSATPSSTCSAQLLTEDLQPADGSAWGNFYAGCGTSIWYSSGPWRGEWAANRNFPISLGVADVAEQCANVATGASAVTFELVEIPSANWECYAYEKASEKDISLFQPGGTSLMRQNYGFYLKEQGPITTTMTTVATTTSMTTSPPTTTTATGPFIDPSCTTEPHADVTSTDGTVFENFYAGCNATIQGIGFYQLQDQTERFYDWDYNNMEDALAACAYLASSSSRLTFGFYRSIGDHWLCMAYGEYSIDASIFEKDDSYNGSYGFAVKTTTVTTTSLTSTIPSTTTSTEAATTTAACDSLPIGVVSAPDGTKYSNFYTGCGTTIEGEPSFAFRLLESDGWYKELAIPRCAQAAKEQGSSVFEFYETNEPGEYFCSTYSGYAADITLFVPNAGVGGSWGFTLESTTTTSSAAAASTTPAPYPDPNCDNSPIADVLGSDGTAYTNFYAGCDSSVQGGLSFQPPYDVSVSFQSVSGWARDTSLTRCAQWASDYSAPSFQFYESLDGQWYCKTFRDYSTDYSVFVQDDSVALSWGFSLRSGPPAAMTTSTTTIASSALMPSTTTAAAVDPDATCTNADVALQVESSDGTIFTNFFNDCASGVASGAPLTTIQSNVYQFSDWTRNEAIADCADFALSVGGQTFEFRRWKGLSNWECTAFTEVTSDVSVFTHGFPQITEAYGYFVSGKANTITSTSSAYSIVTTTGPSVGATADQATPSPTLESTTEALPTTTGAPTITSGTRTTTTSATTTTRVPPPNCSVPAGKELLTVIANDCVDQATYVYDTDLDSFWVQYCQRGISGGTEILDNVVQPSMRDCQNMCAGRSDCMAAVFNGGLCSLYSDYASVDTWIGGGTSDIVWKFPSCEELILPTTTTSITTASDIESLLTTSTGIEIPTTTFSTTTSSTVMAEPSEPQRVSLIIEDYGFESGDSLQSPWVVSSLAGTPLQFVTNGADTTVHSGLFSGVVDAPAGGQAILWQGAVVDASQNYDVKVWLRTTAHPETCTTVVSFLGARGGGSQGEAFAAEGFVAVSSEWTEYTFHLVPEASSGSLRFTFKDCGGAVYVDDVAVSYFEESSPT